MTMSNITTEEKKRIIEGVLMSAGDAVDIKHLIGLFDENNALEKKEIKDILESLAQDYANRAIELVEVANGYRFQVRANLSPWISKLWEEKPPRYSRASLETLALIAYKQPITRAEIEDIRGVAVATTIIRAMLDREWIKVVGHKDVPGHPALYATTKRFLDYFNLKSLEDLPPLSELIDLDSKEKQLELAVAEIEEQEMQDEVEQAESESSFA